MSRPLRWGIMGTGGIAHLQTRDLVDNGFTVAAVGSRSQASADAFAAEFGIATAHANYEALVADPAVDVVYVSTPHPFHAPGAKLALDAGKHVLLEKPFTVTAAEARQVVALAAERGLVVLEAMWTRFLPQSSRVRELIREGAIGDPRALIADHNQLLPTDPAHRINSLALAGGALLDLGIYPVSFAHDLFGVPSRVAAIGDLTAAGVDRQTSIILGFDGGRQAVLHTALDISGPNTATVVGTAGRIQFDSVWYAPTTVTVFDGSGRVIERIEPSEQRADPGATLPVTDDAPASAVRAVGSEVRRTEPVEVASRGMQYQAAELERLVEAGDLGGSILPPAESVSIMETLDEIRRQIGLVYPSDT